MTEEFDVCGPLPRGVTVLEASAGTGKTFTIAALAARYVADGLELDRMLLVTFTRMATGELRERVRERLVETERLLTAALHGERVVEQVAALLATGPRDVVARRRDNLRAAVASFDAATITTTHGFCLEALSGLGVLADAERELSVVEDADDLLEQVVDDLFVRRWHRHAGRPLFDRAEAMRVARAATHNPTAPVEPSSSSVELHAMRARFALRVRDELEARKRRAGVLTYDDLLTRLRATLLGPQGDAAAARLRARYRVVLVDEFQDTDPVQWDVMRRAFAGGDEPDRALVLIGDPKQAVYAFRGADVFAYLAAARGARARATLRTNWRSDQPYLTALDHLFGDARLGHEEIVVRRVRATDDHREHRLRGAGAPLRIRVDDREGATTPRGFAQLGAARERVARDVAADVVRLLRSGATIDGAPVVPGDVAVLVRTHRQAGLVHAALGDAGVPAVINGAGSVFATDAAQAWLALLEALERPTSAPRAHAVALTPFLGWSAREVAEAAEPDWDAVHRRLHGWARVLRTKGVASLLESVAASEGLLARVLGREDGEREATDLRHVGDLLHAAASAERLGVTALAGWLRARIDAAAAEGGDEERARRLESDAASVQVLTIHRSKGLEFPVVICPYLWDAPGTDRTPHPVVFHDPANADARTVDVALGGPDFVRHRAQAETEQRGEDLRLAYVALTRARHQAVLWWAGSFSSRASSLSRLLLARRADGTIAPQCDQVPSDADALTAFRDLAARAGACIDVERLRPEHGLRWHGPPHRDGDLALAVFDRPLDRRWRRTSYSGIVAFAHESRVATEPEGVRPPDEAPDDALPVRGEAPGGEELRAVALPLAEMPGGRRIGTFVHAVLEAADFAAQDLDAELAGHVDAQLARRPLDVGDRDALLAGLRAVVETPIGDGLRLRDVRRADRLDELVFELPLAGGDVPTGAVALDALADVLERHLPAGDPLAGYPARLRGGDLAGDLRGYLTGSIDLVIRAPDGRFVVADHKTNRLAPPGEAIGAWHYRPGALRAVMHDAHYALQGLLYGVALHRFLRWRLAGYDPDAHLGGVRYLFVRGMLGAATPVAEGGRCGVFRWEPPRGLVPALSDVLDGEPAA